MTVTPGDAMDAESETKARLMVFTKMEKLVREMQHPETGVPVRSQKTFLTSLPCVFMGYDLIEWLMERLTLEDSAEAIHLANLLCQYGYFFPVPDSKNLVVKDDGSYYRFQTPYFWPTQNNNPDSTEYAIYLVKRSLRNKQKHGLEDYEQDTLNKLKKLLSHKWEFVTMQAEEQLKLAKERKKLDKIVVDSQERAYWRVHWTPPGCLSSLETCPVPLRQNNSRKRKKSRDDFALEITQLKEALSRTRLKVSQAVESLIHHCEVYADYDPAVIGTQPSNPWITDDVTFWVQNDNIVEIPTEKRVRRWAINLHDLLSDPTGIQEFESYLLKEYSHENVRFWKSVESLHTTSKSNVDKLVKEIYDEYLAAGAPCEVNLDSQTVEATQQSMKNPTRFTFDAAQQHVYSLMKKDSYPRFLRSDVYKNLLANAVQPSHKKRFFNFGVGVKKKNSPSGGNNTINSGASVKSRGSNTNLSGSTSDLRNEIQRNEWATGLTNIINHSLSASNLHDLDNSDSPYRLSSPSCKEKGSGYFGNLNVSKPKALSTESCNTTPCHHRNMDLTLEVPSHVVHSSSPGQNPDTCRSSASSRDPSPSEGGSVTMEEPAGQRPTKSYNDVCPWEDMELPKKPNEVCPWDDQ